MPLVKFPPRDQQLDMLLWLSYRVYSWSRPETGPTPELDLDDFKKAGWKQEDIDAILAQQSHGGLVPHPIDQEGRAVWFGRYLQLYAERWQDHERCKQRTFHEVEAAVRGVPADPLPPL